MILLDTIPFELNDARIFKQMHVDGDSEMAEEIRIVIRHAREAVRPKAACKPVFIEARTGTTIELDDGTAFQSDKLASFLENVERAFLYICTCGAELDRLDFGSDNMLAPYCMDIIKEQALGAAIAALREHLQVQFKPGKLSSMSPGSGPRDLWPIQQQTALFKAFGDTESLLGVSLTPSCLMVPNKTVSGMLFPREVEFVSCRLCPRENCPRRRAPYDEHADGAE